MNMDMDMAMDPESRMMRAQKQYLESVLTKVKNQHDYINRTTSDRLSEYYYGFLKDFKETQEKCERASINITHSIDHLKEIEDLIMQINATIEASKVKLNIKIGDTTLQGRVRTYILNNPQDYGKFINYKKKDIENAHDSKNIKMQKEKRRKKNYIVKDTLDLIGNEDPGTADDYFEEEEEEVFDPYDYDTLWGTSTHPLTPLTINQPSPLTINPPPPRSKGGRLINSRNIYRKRKTKTNRSKNKRNKTKSNKKK